jgi:hypothetical protein
MAEQAKAAKAAPKLAPASESSDPAVHQLIAEQQTAHMNGDQARVAEVAAALAELGFE